MTNRKANRLINSSSPYLQQHAYNPVDWHPWGKEAQELSAQTGKPILLSIGYSSCHWCHVMEQESFENEAIASVMNERFINIKVDREERPDIDAIYMDAIHAMGSQGGWPLTIFLTPQLKPIYGGTYFPPQNFLNLITQVSTAYQSKKEEIESSADQVTVAISGSEIEKFGLKYHPNVDIENVHLMFQQFQKKFDHEFGGMSRAPKFPMPGTWKFLLHYGFLFEESEGLKHTLFTLDKIGDGGIYDQIGGGFARYSTDKMWLVPHFEKMLYDNGQLFTVFSQAYALSHKPRYLQILNETFSWLEREMSHSEGGFYSALDADSEGVEGKYYVWSWEEFSKLAGKNSEQMAASLGITKAGNWEGNNILLRNEAEISDPERLEDFKSKLLDTRERRIRPGLDDKVICSWNAIMSQGLIDAYNATGDDKFLNKALTNADFIKSKLFVENRLIRSWKDAAHGSFGFLEDYACTCQMFLNLYQATFEEEHLNFSLKLIDLAIDYFGDSSDPFFYFSETGDDLIVRKKEIMDNVIPSSNSVMANCLFQAGILMGDQKMIDRAREMTFNFLDLMLSEPEYASNWALLYSFFTYPTNEVAIAGKEYQSVGKNLRNDYFPNKVLAGTKDESPLPLLKDKAVPDKTLIYVCKDHACQLPVEEPDEARRQMRDAVKFEP